MGQNSCFVAVHFGAGFHSKDKESLFRKLMESCCILTLQNLEFSDNIIESLVLGIKVLEDSGILNAGIGSNRNVEGLIEADASIMQLDPPCLGSVGCVSDVQNPIEYAKSAFYNAQESKKMSSVTFGTKSKSKYVERWSSSETCLSNSDTVGIICIDSKGRMAMACSSGGPEGKCRGRIGPCAIPGSGFWGITSEEGISCASLFTGVGEHIIIKGCARITTEYMTGNSMDLDKDRFLENLYNYNNGEQLLEFGFISICISKGMIEIFASHSTPSFIYGWKLSGKSVRTEISRLEDKKFRSFATCLQIKS